MPKKEAHPHPKHHKIVTLPMALLLIIVAVLSSILVLQLSFYNKLYPGISINEVDVSTLSEQEAKQRVLDSQNKLVQQPLTFSYEGKDYTIDLNSSLLKDKINSDLDQTIDQAFTYGKVKWYWPPLNLVVPITFNGQLDKQLATISKKVEDPPLNSQLKIDQAQITVTPSENGLVLNQDALQKILMVYLQTGQLASSNLPVQEAKPNLDYQTAIQIKKTLDFVREKPLTLKYQEQKFVLDFDKLLALLDLSGKKPLSPTDPLPIDSTKLAEYIGTLETAINRPVKEPLFNFDGQKVSEFQAPQEGLKLKNSETITVLKQSLLNNQEVADLPVEVIPTQNKLANELGIKEAVGRGESHFAGSIPNRIYNVGLAASRINGVIVGPGKTFSFTGTVGDISAATGYKQAYVIKSGRTVLDDGGGVCQVSTTLFRAILNAGLPITDRTAHAYRVGYYEQGFPPGLDATIFHPSVDLKFKNDTAASILIQARVDGTNLYVDLYGTSDGRVAEISKPIITSQTPAPPELRQDDPTLPKGTVKQVDFAAAGANVSFTRKVTRDGQTIINETFRSNYRPWQAVFLVGTKEG